MKAQNFITYYTEEGYDHPLHEEKFNFQAVDFYEDWDIQEMSAICPLIKQWRTKDLTLDQNNYPLILKEIRTISFPFLSNISLGQNNILSVQGLSRMEMPTLRQISLANNNLRSIIDLKKSNFKNLQKIYLQGNYILDGQTLSLMKVEELWSFSFQFENEDAGQCHSLRWMGKFITATTKQFQQIYVVNEDRIKENAVELLIEKGFDFEVNPIF